MAAGDLTTLANVKAWLNITDTSQDAVLARLITAISSRIRTHLDRFSLLSQQYTDQRDGTGTNLFLLRNWPVTSVAQVVVDGAVVPPAPSVPVGGLGYTTEPAGWTLSPYSGYPPGTHQTLSLCGWRFCHGVMNVSVTYTAGYLQPSERATVPASSPYTYTVAAPQGPWAGDNGVVYASTGASLLPVSGTPAQGQYNVSAGVYTFSAADQGQSMLVSYSFTPEELEQICIEWVAERNTYRNGRIGIRSKSLGGQETMSYAPDDVPADISRALRPWRDLVPLPA